VSATYRIHPKIGVARVGNSGAAATGYTPNVAAHGEFYIGPETTGGLPVECDRFGNPVVVKGREQPVRRFKDRTGAIKRQAARFKVFAHDDEDGSCREVTLGDEVTAIRWTVHLANKKAVWYNFNELLGDLTFGPWNSYDNQHVALRNASTTGAERRALMIDPGPRSVSEPRQRVPFSRYNVPADYPHASFPPLGLDPTPLMPLNSLGDLLMDDDGRLLVLGGYGWAGGAGDISSFAGANDWFDDVSDGFVLATLTLADGTTVDLEPAYVIVGSPKYAPELVNIITLDDLEFDVAVRHLGYAPDLYDPERWPDTDRDGAGGADGDGDDAYNPFAGFNPDYRPNYRRDVEPIVKRPEAYRWVAQVPSMIDFASPPFDPADPRKRNRKHREQYFGYFRVPVPPESYRHIDRVDNGPNQLFAADGVPLMPLNSGDNSVRNQIIYKFLSLTPTQYFFLKQWSLGLFTTGDAPPDDRGGVTPLDRQVVGNCVGGPLSPGIETTWIMRNPRVYSAPFTVKPAHWEGSNAALGAYYAAHGLSTTSDPDDGSGSEPGDLTKRMAIPWMADFFDCTIQTVNVDNPAINQDPNDSGVATPPDYYVYWWPPQSPMQVVAGDLDPGNQVLDGYISNPPQARTNSDAAFELFGSFVITAAGQTVTYARGINSFNQMVVSWSDLGFILNRGTARYRNFVESERGTVSLAQGVALGVK
jgi:L-lysine 6-oxidase